MTDANPNDPGTQGAALPPPFIPGGAPARSEPTPAPAAPDAPAVPAAQEPEDPFPFDAFDLEGEEAAGGEGQDPDAASPGGEELDTVPVESLVKPDPEPTPAEETPAAAPALEAASVANAADRLEALAAVLRSSGAPGVEAEMASPDRLTALLAGLLAGYLAGRE